MKERTGLNCSVGIATSRLVAKICSDYAKPNGVLWVAPGAEAAFLAPLEVRKIPGVGKVTERSLHALGIRKVGDLARFDETFLQQRFGKWGLALAGKARGADAGGWFDSEIGAGDDPKSISHEHTFDRDTPDAARIDSTLARLAEKVGRRLREHGLFARTVQLKLRYSDFSTITRARTLDHATDIDIELIEQARALFLKNWNRKPVRLVGVHAGSLEPAQGQMSLLDGDRQERWHKALEAVDKIRDRYGETSVSLASGLKGDYVERVQENPAGLPGKAPKGH
jgi:DNA polymerase-4